MSTYYDDRFGAGADVVDATRPVRARLLDRARLKAAALCLVAATIVSAIVEVTAISPRLEAAGDVNARADLLAIENASNESTLGDYSSFDRQKADIDRRYESALTAIPTEAELPAVLAALQDLSDSTGARLVQFTPVKSAQGSTGQDVGSAAKLGRANVTVVVRGGYDQVQNLLQALGGYSRLLTVDRIRARQALATGSACEATIELTCYFKRGLATSS